MPSTVLQVGALAGAMAGVVASSAGASSAVAGADDAAFARSFVQAWCVECHGGERPKARLNLESFAASMEAIDALDAEPLRLMREMIDSGEMPPEGHPRPGADDVAAMKAIITRWIEERQAATPAAPDAPVAIGQVVMRRLNRAEYTNTIRDLLSIDFDAGSVFPADEVGHGFDNNGDVLSMPPLLFEKYLDAAERIAAQAFPDPLPPAPPLRAVPGEQLKRDDDQPARSRDGAQHLWSNATVFFQHEFPVDGRYRFRVRAGGQQAGPELVKVAFVVDRRTLHTVEVPATYAEPGDYTCEASVKAGSRRVGAAFVNDFYQPDHPDPSKRDRNCAIFELSVEGPLDAPPARPEQIDPQRESNSQAWVRRTIETLAPRVFRRPVPRADIEELLALAGDGGTPESRLRTAVTAMLVSPRFLYRPEPSTGERRDLDGHEIASRLSYFIWSSTPDDDLLAAAGRGELDTGDGVAAHARRLLADPRSIALAEHFATQWLQVRDVERREMDRDRFPDVTPAMLEAMKAETILFFDAILRERRDVSELVSADFTFVNERLARHYGLPGVRGDYMRRVRLPAGVRGGVVTQAAVLTATSNPTRTSPVKRGKWILEALLDAPPPPPPPGVDSFEKAKEATGATTVREILALHRSDPNCSVCHRRMDALGFALEEFDAVGRRRASDDGQPIDSRGELPDGRTLDGAADLRQLLLTDAALHRSLARHLLTYALGRGTDNHDEPALDSLVESMRADPTIPALIDAIVRLDSFRRGGMDR